MNVNNNNITIVFLKMILSFSDVILLAEFIAPLAFFSLDKCLSKHDSIFSMELMRWRKMKNLEMTFADEIKSVEWNRVGNSS